MKTETPIHLVDTTAPLSSSWFIVSQVKSYRVVYFTDDPDYTPPMHGDWYYVSPYTGKLPKGMTLRNCWRWRFDGHAFIDASDAKPKSQEETLLQANKVALLKLLHEKINALRRPFAPSSLLGEQIRSAKLLEARVILDGGLADLQDSYLVDAAAANACTLHDMAWRIVQQQDAGQAMLRQTEKLRESMAAAISSATTQAALIAVRQRLMSEVAPDLNAQFVIKPEHTTARKLAAKPDAQELTQEKFRLSVQLREKINDLRRPYLSQYLLDDVVLKHKGQIAQALMAAGGALPAGLDGAVLISHAAARSQTLLAAARDVLTEMNETARVLLDTEQLKDAWSVRISGVQSFKDIEELGHAIPRLRLPPYQAPQAKVMEATS